MYTVKTVLELYDMYVVSELKKKHTSVPKANWIFAPPEKEIGFRYAQEQFGKNKIFPIYFVFRNTPALRTADMTHISKYNLDFDVGDDKRDINIVDVSITYQIDFYSNYMNDLNNFNIDYFRFQKKRFLEFDFSELSLNYKNKHEVLFEDIEANHTIQEMFDVGRYFRYTYNISLIVPLFDLKNAVEIDKFVLGVYTQSVQPQNLVYQKTETIK